MLQTHSLAAHEVQLELDEACGFLGASVLEE
jgi:hypothetical protein